MPNGKIILPLLALMISSQVMATDQASESCPAPSAPAAQADLPWAEISQVTIEPTEILLANANEATITVQIAHTPIESEQALTLSVGTFSTDAQAGVSISYDPPSQIVHLPPDPQGRVIATAKVLRPKIEANKQAAIVIGASIKSASPGIRIENDQLGLPNHVATLTIRAK